jgi:integrase/recombinase XerD
MRERIKQYLKFLAQEEGYSENTTAAYRNDLMQFYEWLKTQYKTKKSWDKVKRQDIANYLFYFRKLEYATSTKARKLASVNLFFLHIMDCEEIYENPVADFNSPKVKRDTPEGLSRESLIRLLAAPAKLDNPKGRRDRAMLELLSGSGLRVTELVNLRVDDIDLEQWTVHCGKGQNERRVPITARACGALREYLAKGREQLVRQPDHAFLFMNMRGKKLTRQGLWLIIKNYVKQAAITEEVTPYTLRHSYAIHQLKEGSDLEELQELLGHVNITTTQIYAP